MVICLERDAAGPADATAIHCPQLIPVLGSQPAGDVSHKPSGRLLLLSARPAVTRDVKREPENR